MRAHNAGDKPGADELDDNAKDVIAVAEENQANATALMEAAKAGDMDKVEDCCAKACRLAAMMLWAIGDE